MCGPEGMNKQLVMRYIEVSTVLLAPITPHTSEHTWQNLLHQPSSIIKAGWPQAAEPDFIMQRAAKYIEGEQLVLSCQHASGVKQQRSSFLH